MSSDPHAAPRSPNTGHRRLGVPLLGVVALCAFQTAACESCSDVDEAKPTQQASQPAPPDASTNDSLPSDFALIPSPTGATLVWATASPAEWALSALQFDRGGVQLGPPTTIVPASGTIRVISDVQALWAGDSLVVLWLSQSDAEADERRARAMAWLGTPESGGDTFELSRAWATSPSNHGNLALALRDEGATALIRGPQEPCAETPEQPCHDFTFHQLGAGVSPETGRVTLSVPVPCENNAARLMNLGQRWHYAVCTQHEGRSVTTVFSITPSPQYAEAQRLLPDCAPLGLTYRRGVPYLIAQCAAGLSASRVGSEGGAAVLELGTPDVRCTSGRYEVDAGPLSFALREPRADLHTWVPAPNSRLVWTGQRLMEAKRQSDGLSLELRQCTPGGEKRERRAIPRRLTSPHGVKQNFIGE